jgi:hypothetical protein
VTEVQEPAAKEVSVQLRMQGGIVDVFWANAGTRAAARMATASLNMIDRCRRLNLKLLPQRGGSGRTIPPHVQVVFGHLKEARPFSSQHPAPGAFPGASTKDPWITPGTPHYGAKQREIVCCRGVAPACISRGSHHSFQAGVVSPSRLRRRSEVYTAWFRA